MDMSQQIEAVYRRALLLRQYATKPQTSPDLLEKALQELYFVLEELQTSQEELHQQHQALIATQQAVELERQRYRDLFELAPNGYVVTDLQGNIQQVNRYAATHLFGTEAEYLIHKPLIVFIDEPDRSQFQLQLAQLNSGDSWETTLHPRQNRWIAVAIAVTHLSTLCTDNEMPHPSELLLWSLHDISQRQQMEQQLQAAHDQLEQRVAERTVELLQINTQLQQEIDQRQQAEQKIRDQAALIDIATDAIFVQDLEHRILFWSRGAERVYGWTASEILGQSAQLLFHQEAMTQLETGFTQTLQQGAWHNELDQVTRGGTPILVASRWTLMRNAADQPQSILVVNTDITEKRQLEMQFYRAQRVESLGTLCSGIIHDLINIFTPILGLSQWQLSQQPDLDRQTREVWEWIRNDAQQGANLVQQIALFARGTSGRKTHLQVEDILPNLVAITRRTFPANIDIKMQIVSVPLRSVVADLTQLYQVIMNLCVNARDAMPEGGTLTLSVENFVVKPEITSIHPNAHIGDYVVITIADTGSGIPSELIDHIFEPFFTTKEYGKGSGLGLASVASIVKKHDGFITVSSQPGQGSQFKVYLPAAF